MNYSSAMAGIDSQMQMALKCVIDQETTTSEQEEKKNIALASMNKFIESLHTHSEETESEETASEETVSEETASEETVSEETASEETAVGEIHTTLGNSLSSNKDNPISCASCGTAFLVRYYLVLTTSCYEYKTVCPDCARSPCIGVCDLSSSVRVCHSYGAELVEFFCYNEGFGNNTGYLVCNSCMEVETDKNDTASDSGCEGWGSASYNGSESD